MRDQPFPVLTMTFSVSLAERLKQQKNRLSRTRTLIRREDGRTEVEENGIRIAEEPDDKVQTFLMHFSEKP